MSPITHHFYLTAQFAPSHHHYQQQQQQSFSHRQRSLFNSPTA